MTSVIESIRAEYLRYKALAEAAAMKHEPWTHRVENIGTTDIKAILFERK